MFNIKFFSFSKIDDSYLWGLFFIAIAAFLVEIPFFFWGLPIGHDIDFHLYSWLEVLSQWKEGEFYPRWAALANYAYGEPRFIFYPPTSWIIGAALSEFFSWSLVPCIYIWLALVVAGMSMFLLAYQWFYKEEAIFVAILYVINPYQIINIYWRSAYAELMASFAIPLLFLLLAKTNLVGGYRILLALLLGFAWLVDLPAAVMIHYSFVVMLLVIAWQKKSFWILMNGAIAVALGVALVAFFLLPASYEQQWVYISDLISPGMGPKDNFIFINTPNIKHDAFNRVVSWVSLAEILVTIGLVYSSRSWRSKYPQVWWVCIFLAITCSILMLPITSFLWYFLPDLRFVQFPWRWLLCLNVPFSIFILIGLKHWLSRAAIYLLVIAVLIFIGISIQPPRLGQSNELKKIQENMKQYLGYRGTNEYRPMEAYPFSVDKNAPPVSLESKDKAEIDISQWNAEEKIVTVNMLASGNIILHLFNYPAWRIEVNGSQVPAITHKSTGQIMVPLNVGFNIVKISFIRTWDRTIGAWISILTIIFILILSYKYNINVGKR